MGWLRDLMQAASPRYGSYDALARACLHSDRWPDSSRMPVRSLGAILGKLDRGENLGWLAGRPTVQSELANLLDAPRDAIRVALRPDVRHEPARWVTLDTLPYARGLDLLDEELFPGIPDAVLHPGQWSRLVWIAPPGAGRSLTGRWLEARGLCRRHRALRFDEADLPRARPLYVELASGQGFDPDQIPPRTCVAVPAPWTPSAGSGVSVVRSPPIAELIEPLLAWCHARLSSRSALEPARLARLIRNKLLDEGVVESAGDVLGLAGLADEHGTDVLETRSLRRLANELVKQRARERLDSDGPGAASVRRDGFEAIVALGRRFALDASEAPFVPRSAEEWSRLLPAELRHGADLDWLKAALPDSALSAGDLERAAKKLPPGAFRLLRALEELGLFERDEHDRLALRPHWLARVASSEALSEIVSGSPLDWGEALLNPRVSAGVAQRLLRRSKAGELEIDELVEPVADDVPAHAAAIEGAFRSVGVSALLGGEPAHDLCHALWDEALALVFEMPGGLPAPRIDHEHAREPGAWTLSRGAFYLSALALGEIVDERPPRRLAVLGPWQENAPPAGLAELLDEVAALLELPGAPSELFAPTAELIARLRSVLGRLGAGGSVHRLERPAELADELALGVVAWQSIEELAGDAYAIAGFCRLLVRRGLDASLADAVWQAHRDAGSPSRGAEVLLQPGLAELVWRSAPDDALELLATLPGGTVIAAELPPERLERLFTRDLSRTPLELFTLVPNEALAVVCTHAARCDRRDALDLLWRRHPNALSALAGASLSGAGPLDAETLKALLQAAPEEATGALVRGLGDASLLLRAPLETLLAVRKLLHERLARRAAGFRDAYSLFHHIESHYASVLRQS